MKSLLFIVVALVLAVRPSIAAEDFESGDRLGVSLGTPSGLNLEYAHEFGPRSLFVSGAWFGTFYGIQVGVSTVRWGSPRTHFAINVVAGHTVLEDEGDRWTYGGVEGDFHHGKFFVAPGLSVGDGTFPSPQLLARLGFTWRL